MDENTIFQLQQQQERGFRLQRLKQDLESLEESAPHDFGWALRHMRAGKCVKAEYIRLRMKEDKLQYWVRIPIGSHWDNADTWVSISDIVLHTEWAICADPEGVE